MGMTTRAPMSSNSSSENSSHQGNDHDPPDTDILGMQDLLARHSHGLPQPRSDFRLSSDRKAIAIVGSTGFLGPYVLASMLRVHPESRIFCLNRSADGGQRTVAALEQVAGINSSTDLARLRFLVADITKPDLGLDTSQTTLLASELDELIFNAWDTNWSKPLAHFDPFVRAVRHAVDFCASALKHPRITFISSICSVGAWPLVYPTQPRVPEAVVWDNRGAMPHGYGESKCVAEQLLANAHHVSGVDVNIVRAGQIGGPIMSATETWPRQGWIYSILKASDRLGFFPRHVLPLDWIPVDAFSDGIANSAKLPRNLDTVQVFNMVHPEPAPWNTLYETLQHRFGLSAEPSSLTEWLERLDAGKWKLHGFLTAFQDGREYNMSFRNERAAGVLPRVEPIHEDLLAGWLEGWGLQLNGPKPNL